MDPAVLQRRYERERTARREAEQLLEEKSREVYAVNQELSATLGELQDMQAQLVQNEKLASIGQMAAGVAHEINNPIGFIASNLGSLRHYVDDLKKIIEVDNQLIVACENTPGQLEQTVGAATTARTDADLDFLLEDVDSLVKDSLDGTERIKRIVGDLRDFSHVDKPDVSEVDLNELIAQTITVAAHELKYKAEVKTEFAQLPPIPCHGGRIGQVILNMLINAVHAIETKGVITVRTGELEDDVWFEIEDDGVGISEKVIGRIFDPFFTTKDVGKGTGLGLHLSRNIINNHGGEITVCSSIGVGTNLRVTLPKAGPPTTDDADNID